MEEEAKPYIGGHVLLVKGVPCQFNGNTIERIDTTKNYINMAGDECVWDGKTFVPRGKYISREQTQVPTRLTREGETESLTPVQSKWKEVFWFYVILYLSSIGMSYLLPSWLFAVILGSSSLWLLWVFLKVPNQRDYRGQDNGGEL